MRTLIIKGILQIAIILTIFCSCQKQEFDKVLSWSYPLSGEWALKLEVGTDVYQGPFLIKIYNTSFGQDSVWVDDNGNIWPFKVKAKADMNSLTFSTTAYLSLPGTSGEDIMTITNGKVVGKDSIYFEAEFGSDAGTVYKMYGHRASGYEEYNMPH